MRNILVPTDFSPASKVAAEYAAALARVLNATIQLLHVYQEPAAVGEVPSVWMLTETLLQEENAALVQEESNYLVTKYGIRVKGEARCGLRNDEIHAVAEKTGADLIVMGMKGGGKSRWMGSTTITTIQRANVPVLVVPDCAVYATPKHITFASDFDDRTTVSSLQLLLQLLERFQARLHIVNVQKREAVSKTFETPGKQKLEAFFAGCPHSFYLMKNNDVVAGINEFIGNQPTDLLVMVAHYHNLLERMFRVLHTTAMSHQTKLPLLVLKERK